ncbi:hypothetical protein IMSHALPRED_001206 [Imshaugia aleurites]|uniref:Uncharacterized protein n=1 Tax=Imshaugia aleurites TaxID=172621 RepID=A0A8H3J1W6_9LECA|nr:hypothetical protein IMSHALPRED_001206 [Imshaugia aleurites]
MSYYEAQSWQIPAQQASWEQLPPPSRMGRPIEEKFSPQTQAQKHAGTSSALQHDNVPAFDDQIEEVNRALDNLNKSGKLFSPPPRRDSMPMMGGPRAFSDFDPRMTSMPQRHHSIGDFDQARPHSSSNLQNFYANQRHQPRPSEAEQMLQAKRRMAAQRERELRNYHQEQQYNRNVVADISTQGKSDRAISPNTMNEEDRRELIARQHRALYGNEMNQPLENSYGGESHTPRPSNPTSGNTNAGGRGPSPRTYDPYAMGQNQAQAAIAEAGAQLNASDQSQQAAPTGPSPKPQQQQRSRADSTSSPASNPPSQSFSLFESAAQQSSRTSTSSPGGSPPRQTKTSAPSGVAPIGTRPAQIQASNPILNNKRSNTPSPSPLGFGFAQNNDSLNPISNSANERSTSAASNPTSSGAKDAGMAWGTGSGVWGNNNNKSLQASVWG